MCAKALIRRVDRKRRLRSGLVAVPVLDGRLRRRLVYVHLGGMVDIAVHELGATLTQVERLEPTPSDPPPN